MLPGKGVNGQGGNGTGEAAHPCQQQGVVEDSKSDVDWALGSFQAQVFFYSRRQCILADGQHVAHDGTPFCVARRRFEDMRCKLVGLLVPRVWVQPD